MLLHINRIDYARADQLGWPLHILETNCVHFPSPTPWYQLPTVGLATLEETTERDKGILFYNVKLTARLCGTRLDLPRAPLSFRLYTASGEQFLLGLDHTPHPLTLLHLTTTDNAAEPSVYSLEVTHKTDWPLPRIIGANGEPLSFTTE